MAEATMQGVSLYSKDRGRSGDVFELALTYDGIEIRRPGESARHLSWDRITEWEIEQRRGGVLLILRGGGSVTPLVIPKWKVDDLDIVLRDVTSGLADPANEPATEVVTPPVREPEAESEPEVEAVVEVEVEAEPEPEPVVESVPEPELAPEPVVESVLAVAAETVAEPTREPTFEDVVSKAFTPPRNPEFEVVLHAGPATEEAEVDGTLVWPANSPLEGLPELVWPTEESQEETPDLVWPAEPTVGDQGGPMAVDLVVDLPSSPPLPESPDLVWPAESINDPVDTEFMSERLSTTAQESPVLREAPDRAPASRSSAAWVIEDVPDLPPVMAASASSAAPPLPKVPDATASTEHPPLFVAPVKSAPARTQDVEVPTKATRTRAGQRKRIRRQFSRQTATTILLLGVLALAVALVLAQSAGLVHLGFLGSPA